ncbi:MAG TPA: hypothetical protein VH309_05235 [Elusimicrobiota bacterium]|jgi:hypothetical protein|nr:hypothetical protein [Elusimicrobiota bacterium]
MTRNKKTNLIGGLIAGCLLLPGVSRAQLEVPSQGETPVQESHEGPRSIISAIPGVPKIFLPDIGLAGDFVYERDSLPKSDPRFDPTKRQPRIRDGQAVFFSPIDPFTNAQFTIDIPENGVAAISEAWVYFKKLPLDTTARVGRFAPVFGLLDVQNTFQLAMLNRPSSIADYVGAGGMTATGAELDYYVPNPWDLNLKANLTVARGDLLGGTTGTMDLSYLATLDYSRDLFTSGSLQTGVSVAQAPSPYGDFETLVEPYAQVIYQPNERHVLTVSGEGLLAERRDLGNQDFKAGFYAFADYGFKLRYHVGFLVDVADQPGTVPGSPTILPPGRQLSLAPNATWFVSDNTRLRLQYTHTTPLASERPDETASLQLTFSLGNLKQMD